MHKIDKKDHKIIKLLSDNSRLSHNQIAKELKLSKNAVSSRIEKLKEEKIISKFFPVLNFSALKIYPFVVLLRFSPNLEKAALLVEELKNCPYIMVIDSLSGEWDLMFEFGCKTFENYLVVLSGLERFSDAIECYEVHHIKETYKVDMLPSSVFPGLSKRVSSIPRPKKEGRPFSGGKIRFRSGYDLGKKDLALLYELSKDSSCKLVSLARKLGLSYETVSVHIKNMLKNNIIYRFTTLINLEKLGFDVYCVILDVRNLSTEFNLHLKSFILDNPIIRYSFLSGSTGRVFILVAVKELSELDSFINSIKRSFLQHIVLVRYLYLKEQYKYTLFPEGFLDCALT